MVAEELYELGNFESQKQANKNVVQAIKNVAQELGNRPATCRKYYVHPAILAAYQDGSLFAAIEKVDRADNKLKLRPVEQAVLNVLEQHLLQEVEENEQFCFYLSLIVIYYIAVIYDFSPSYYRFIFLSKALS